ncbi:hypothetical protein DB30_06033 [Enhygromyxa salina]|uniref:Uncharacterized protein n=1 Tax=Enhygromyxa salina TaxID=215803 RepID=A0A0C2CZT7_9BACT|nr:hypothetical protein [Enhygromyxa salina]KIG15125.1 hypothetical protein DB30_06033 [Enhygromyxa salina]
MLVPRLIPLCLLSFTLVACGGQNKANDMGGPADELGDPVEPEPAPEPEPDGDVCSVDADCVPAQCCHPTTCVPASQAPDCSEVACTEECQGGTMDCGQGHCSCDAGGCTVVFDNPL